MGHTLEGTCSDTQSKLRLSPRLSLSSTMLLESSPRPCSPASHLLSVSSHTGGQGQAGGGGGGGIVPCCWLSGLVPGVSQLGPWSLHPELQNITFLCTKDAGPCES